jgi:hypothetical protein
MRSAFRHGAILLALVGAIGVAVASQVPDEDMSAAMVGPTFPDDETTGSIDRSAPLTQSLPLSDEQLGFVFLGVMNLPDMPDADVAAPGPAAALPDTVTLQDLPAMVIRKIPLLRDHKFVKLDDRILVVRPADRIVVSEIPRYRILP